MPLPMSIPKYTPLEHCAGGNDSQSPQPSPCRGGGSRIDYLLWGSILAVVLCYAYAALGLDRLFGVAWLAEFSASVYSLMHTIWWGMLIGILMIALLAAVPRALVLTALGTNRGLSGIVRATVAGLLLDLCSHGILMVGAKLYERGATTGQVMAFLIASPWNSFSLTLILIALIGLAWTFVFIVCSLVIGVLTGWLFDRLVARGVLPGNPNRFELAEDFRWWGFLREQWSGFRFSWAWLWGMLWRGLLDSRMVVRWILFGVLLTAGVRVLIDGDTFSSYFGPTVLGLLMTLAVATVLEICSEGSAPIAADLLKVAGAPGNSFAFLMTGVATDYTEIMILKDTTRSWKIALFLPLLTTPQILVLAWLMNQSVT